MDASVDVEIIARLLAAHAVLLLAAGLLALCAAAAVLVATVRVVVRYGRPLSFLVPLVPGGYLLVHLAVGLALSAGCTAFVVIAEEVLGGGELVQFDLAFAEALRETTSASWERRFAAVTRLGNTDVLAAAVVVVAIGLIATGRRMMAAGWALSQAGGGVLNATLKELFERTRPDYADPILTSGSWSFPSGHAMGTFIACGVGAYLVLRSVSGWGARATVVVIALAWSLVMSFSRLYLGVHYASDVVAGLVAGVAWVAVCVSGFELAFGRSRPAMR